MHTMRLSIGIPKIINIAQDSTCPVSAFCHASHDFFPMELEWVLPAYTHFFFFLRKKLMDFINKIQLHPIVKSNQYEMGHLPSMHF